MIAGVLPATLESVRKIPQAAATHTANKKSCTSVREIGPIAKVKLKNPLDMFLGKRTFAIANIIQAQDKIYCYILYVIYSIPTRLSLVKISVLFYSC